MTYPLVKTVNDKNRRSFHELPGGFTLIELLVTVAIIALLISILLPALSQARLQAKVTAVRAELNSIAIALETYALENREQFPPTRADCSWNARAHWFALPLELTTQGYLPRAESNGVVYAGVEDRFHPGYTYKYMKAGTRLDSCGSPTVQWLWVPGGFPDYDDGSIKGYNNVKDSPVTWILFSCGPRCDETMTAKDDFPLRRRYWFDGHSKQGLLVRVRLRGGRHMSN